MRRLRNLNSTALDWAGILGTPYVGVPAEQVPSSGENGAGIAYAWLEFPDDAGKDVRVLITTQPESGTLYVYDDSSFTYSGGNATAEAQLYLDGVSVGTPQTVTITMEGAPHEVATVAAVAQPTAGSLSISQTHGASPTGAESQPAASTVSVQQGGQHDIVVTGAVSQPTAGALSISQAHGASPTGASAQPTAATVSVYSGAPMALVVPVAAEAQPTASTVAASQTYGVRPQPALASPVAEAITVGQAHNVGVAPATAQPSASAVWLPLPDGLVPRVALGARLRVSVLADRVQTHAAPGGLQ